MRPDINTSGTNGGDHRLLPAVLLASLLLCGCASTSRPLGVAVGGAAGAAAGHLAGGGKPGPVVAGAAIGAVAGSLVGSADRELRREGFESGYARGQADAIKRHYWMRQAAERERIQDPEERIIHYLVPGPERTPGGAKLAPHLVAVPVVD